MHPGRLSAGTWLMFGCMLFQPMHIWDYRFRHEVIVVRKQVVGSHGSEYHEEECDHNGEHREHEHQQVGHLSFHLLRVLCRRKRKRRQGEGVCPPHHAEPPHRPLEQ